MLNNFKHITALLLVTIFLLKGSASLLPLFSFSALKTHPAELFTDTETDSSGKERQEREGEQSFIADHKNAFSTGANIAITSLKKKNKGQADYRQTNFFPVATPPPNF
ncbi:hypothetical protein [Agriterribacter sp.]|uniref:hypothetical protein n=1 Tax=Agriterribacter sp. TaxID=2821509 RepID=UPI002B8A402C|nr:hypothetical protein [Agriterribacter sp.]HRO45796.1 hypothetical protein [Agriterribacter sp.]HRQ16749.1 hypothetical protein [Agriterribacter sp.]